jgi:hypothetical protein
MMRVRDLMVLAGVVLLGVCVQVLMVSAEIRETPLKGAEAFACLYYRLDPAMSGRMCQDLAARDDLVDQLIYRQGQEARARGVGLNYMKFQLFHVETQVLGQEGDSAQVRLTAERKRAIHPVFAYFAKALDIAGTYPVDETFDLVREEGRWKVCGNPFGMAAQHP